MADFSFEREKEGRFIIKTSRNHVILPLQNAGFWQSPPHLPPKVSCATWHEEQHHSKAPCTIHSCHIRLAPSLFLLFLDNPSLISVDDTSYPATEFPEGTEAALVFSPSVQRNSVVHNHKPEVLR